MPRDTSVPRPEVIRFRLEGDLRTHKDPHGNQRSRMSFETGCLDLPWDVPFDPNPRYQNENGKTACEIMQSLTDKALRFHDRNRGILVVGESVKVLRENGVTWVEVAVPDKPNVKYGLADGGTTFKVIKKAVLNQKNEIAALQCVTIEVVTGLSNEEVSELVRARNTHSQVSAISMIDQRGGWNFIKNALIGTGYDNLIYVQNDKAHDFSVVDLTTMLIMINPYVKPSGYKKSSEIVHGKNVYGQTVNNLRLFETYEESFHKFTNILPQVLQLFDHIGISLGSLYNKGYKGKVKAGGTKLFQEGTPWDTDVSPFLGKESRLAKSDDDDNGGFFPVKCLWLACFGAFRGMVVEKNGMFAWSMPYKDVVKCFDSTAHRIVAKVRDICGGHPDPDKAARHTNSFWEDPFELLEKARLNYYNDDRAAA